MSGICSSWTKGSEAVSSPMASDRVHGAILFTADIVTLNQRKQNKIEMLCDSQAEILAVK